jgi:hypothetical protein
MIINNTKDGTFFHGARDGPKILVQLHNLSSYYSVSGIIPIKDNILPSSIHFMHRLLHNSA